MPYIAIGGGFYRGTVINYSPPSNAGPGPVNVSSPNLNVEVKPFSAIDLQNSYVYTHFTNLTNGDVVYDNHELISRWNFQMTKAASFKATPWMKTWDWTPTTFGRRCVSFPLR